MSIGSRIKQVRLSIGLKLDPFGQRIGLKKSILSQIENDKATATDRTLLSICKEFGVSENWLRTGEGEMMEDCSEDAELAAAFGNMLSIPDPTAKKEMARLLMEMDEKDVLTVCRFAVKVVKAVDGIIDLEDLD